MLVGPWSIYIYIKCLWVLLTNVYWFRATGGYICGCGRPINLVPLFYFRTQMTRFQCFLSRVTSSLSSKECQFGPPSAGSQYNLLLILFSWTPIYNYTLGYNELNAFLGPLDLLPWRVVGRSVCLSVCLSTPVTRQPMFGFFFKIGGNIPWVNITRCFFRFCKIFNFEFKKK